MTQQPKKNFSFPLKEVSTIIEDILLFQTGFLTQKIKVCSSQRTPHSKSVEIDNIRPQQTIKKKNKAYLQVRCLGMLILFFYVINFLPKIYIKKTQKLVRIALIRQQLSTPIKDHSKRHCLRIVTATSRYRQKGMTSTLACVVVH